MEEKAFMVMKAVLDVLEIYSEQEIGYRAEVSIERLTHYVNSMASQVAYSRANTVEECSEIFLNEILLGEPVWRLLEIPKWTADMLEREFAVIVAEREAVLKRKYKCLTCKYYKAVSTSLGLFEQCTYTPPEKGGSILKHRMTLERYRRRPLELKTKCKMYEKVEESTNLQSE